MMKKYEKIYQEMRKQYTDEEIAESMLIPQDLTPEEMQKANEELMNFRISYLKKQIEEDPLNSDQQKYILKTLLENRKKKL